MSSIWSLRHWRAAINLSWKIAVVVLLGTIAYQLHMVNGAMKGGLDVSVENPELKVDVQADAQHPLPVTIQKDDPTPSYAVQPVPFGPGQPQLNPLSP